MVKLAAMQLLILLLHPDASAPIYMLRKLFTCAV